MDIRKYESFQLQDALKQVKSELGKDAVIISTREKQMYSEKLGQNCKVYEVMAAPSIKETKNVLSPKIGEHLQKAQFPRIQNKNESTIVKGSSVFQKNYGDLSIKDLNSNLKSNLKSNEGLQRLKENELNAKTRSEDKYLVEKDLSEIKKDVQKIRKEIEALPHIEIQDKIQELKVLVHELMREKFRSGLEIKNIHISDILLKLNTAGVQESILNQLCSYLDSLEVPTTEEYTQSVEKIREFYLASAIKYIFKNIRVSGNIFSEQMGQKIFCFIGPSGVGKTTTVAKFAAKLKAKENKITELISLDTFRVAGTDQLRIFSKLLDCSFQEATETEELLGIISKKARSDYILIDTAARSLKNSDELMLLQNLQTLPIPIEFHVLLGAGMKQRDIDETLKAYKSLNISSIIFTKTDESWAYGEILNTAIQSKIPLSYFTTGPHVPNDFELTTKEKIIERLLKL